MEIRERMEAFWCGERPDRIPYTIYHNEWRHTADDPAWKEMLGRGLGVVHHIGTVGQTTKNVTRKTETCTRDGDQVSREVLETPVGEVFTESVRGWRQKYLIEDAGDYEVMTYIARHTEVFPVYDAYHRSVRDLEPFGVPVVGLGRTPMQTILVDYVGLENFALHLYDLREAMLTLYEALLENYRKTVELVAAGPGRFVAVMENFSAETMGPKRYREFLLPVYEELFPVLQEGGKVVGTHYDGRLSSCSAAVAEAPIDVIESLTPPPEGDMKLGVCRAAWPEKLFWVNINVSSYQLSPDELRGLVRSLVEQGAPEARGLAFEVSEHFPRNWKESMPVVLGVLEELS